MVKGVPTKIFVTLSGFWVLRVWGKSFSESVKKRKLLTKIFFSGNFEWSSKNLWKMMSAGVKKCNIKQEIKDLVAVSYNFFKKYIHSKVEKYSVKKSCIFHLILVDIPSILILSVKSKGMGLAWQNLLSMTQVICW